MKLTKYSQLKHGMRVRCRINDNEVNDAKISIDSDGMAYVCQNEHDGDDADDKLGYSYSWYFAWKGEHSEGWNCGISDLESAEGLRAMKVGDVVVDEDGDERTVLEVLSNAFLTGGTGDTFRDYAWSWFTFKEVEEKGWKLKTEDKKQELLDKADEIEKKIDELKKEQKEIKKQIKEY